MEMFRKILIVLISSVMSLAITAPLKAESGPEHQHHSHGHNEHGGTGLSLNQGKKWETDAALRQGMQRINDAVMNAATAYHHDTLTKADAKKLAIQINEQVTYLVNNCKLEPMADATLHVLIGDFLTAAEKISADPLSSDGMPGAVKALQTYPKYFDHQGWGNLTHK